jgi:hypothetical protein
MNDKLKSGFALEDTKESLKKYTLLVVIAFLASVVLNIITLYSVLSAGRVELVFLDNSKYDTPILLEKASENKVPVKSDRFIRGFVRNFIGFYFSNPKDSDEFVKKGLAWLFAHSVSKNQLRFASFNKNFKEYLQQKQSRYERFYPINDPSTLKIRPSENEQRMFFVEQPGTYNVVTSKGEGMTAAVLKIKVKYDPQVISDRPTDLGDFNISGLLVESATMEWEKDPISKEIQIHDLFKVNNNE